MNLPHGLCKHHSADCLKPWSCAATRRQMPTHLFIADACIFLSLVLRRSNVDECNSPYTTLQHAISPNGRLQGGVALYVWLCKAATVRKEANGTVLDVQTCSACVCTLHIIASVRGTLAEWQLLYYQLTVGSVPASPA